MSTKRKVEKLMKRFLSALFVVFFSVYLFAEQCDSTIREKLIVIYEQYAKSTSVEDRAQFCLNPNLETMKKYYEGQNLGYTPKKFGDADYYPEEDIYILGEYVDAKNAFRTYEVKVNRYFKKGTEGFKIDWEGSIGYNQLSLAKYNAMKTEEELEFRCYAGLSTSYMDNYYCFSIRDANLSYQFDAYVLKTSESGNNLFNLYTGSEYRPVVLKIQYSNIYKRYFITDFVKLRWNVIEKDVAIDFNSNTTENEGYIETTIKEINLKKEEFDNKKICIRNIYILGVDQMDSNQIIFAVVYENNNNLQSIKIPMSVAIKDNLVGKLNNAINCYGVFHIDAKLGSYIQIESIE